MPTTQPTTSYLNIRNYAEKFSWRDPSSGSAVIGFNPPADAVEVERVGFRLLAVSESGHRIEGLVKCIKVDPSKLMRQVRFCEDDGSHHKGDVRWVFDKFIIEIDGVRFVTH